MTGTREDHGTELEESNRQVVDLGEEALSRHENREAEGFAEEGKAAGELLKDVGGAIGNLGEGVGEYLRGKVEQETQDFSPAARELITDVSAVGGEAVEAVAQVGARLAQGAIEVGGELVATVGEVVGGVADAYVAHREGEDLGDVLHDVGVAGGKALASGAADILAAGAGGALGAFGEVADSVEDAVGSVTDDWFQ